MRRLSTWRPIVLTGLLLLPACSNSVGATVSDAALEPSIADASADDSSVGDPAADCLDSCEVPPFVIAPLGDSWDFDLNPIDANLGQIPVGSYADFTFRFENNTGHSVAIFNALFSGPVVCNLSCPTGEMAAGETREWTVRAICTTPGSFEEDGVLHDSFSDAWRVPVLGECVP